MGTSESKPSNCVDQPWWSIENEAYYFVLNQPNLNEIFATINEPNEIKYETVREKILAKLRDRKYSTNSEDSYYSCGGEDQNSSGENQNNQNNNIVINRNKSVRTRSISSTSSSRSNSESEPTSSLPSTSICVEDTTTTAAAAETTTATTTTTLDDNNLDDENTLLRVPQTLDEFREELRIKRMTRQSAINDLRTELNTLRRQLAEERELNRHLKNGGDINLMMTKQMKDIAIGTDNSNLENVEEHKNNNASNSSSISTQTNDNDEDVGNLNDKTIKKCDICIQTDETFVNNNDNCCNCNCQQNYNNNDDEELPRTRRNRTSSDSQQIILKSQLAELQLSLQLANADNLSLTTELAVIKKQVASLKEVIACSRQMIDVREEQVQQLKAKLRQIEESLADREIKIMSENLRQEYDRQLENIRNLRQLYEERARVSAAERENLLRQIAIKKDEFAVEVLKGKTMAERISKLENELAAVKDKLNETKEERDDLYIENKSLKEEMAVINKLFSQMLVGFNGTDNLDIDSLTTMLEENRILLNEIAIKEGNTEGASLPKLLFDIVSQANKNESYEEVYKLKGEENQLDEDVDKKILKLSNNINENNETNIKQPSEMIKVTSTQEIIGNLPKVWKILIEFLNHQKVEQVQFKENGQSEECYKSVQTSNGIKSEISVSKTYLKLKDLILEKKSLMKETNRLKTLNSHLERRLDEQEKRLSVVSLELTKTWHLVGKMQRQHRQLHTHEQILRYQLQQKKRLLNELKEELEYCRRKWTAARAKNAESQLQFDEMRREFAKRKLQDVNNSAESGYSDGPASSSDEESSPTIKKSFKDLLDPPRKIERTSSISPTRLHLNNIVIRGSSAPPVTTFLTELIHTTDEITTQEPLQNIASTSTEPDQPIAKATLPPAASRVDKNVENNSSGNENNNSGAIPKIGIKNLKLSRGKKLDKYINNSDKESESLEEIFNRISGKKDENVSQTNSLTKDNCDDEGKSNCTERIHKLEEQCKSLIAQVIETTENREKLEVQICQFKAELGPAQYPVSLDEYITKRRSSIQETLKESKEEDSPKRNNASCLTAREEEYTSKRSERLRRLEEESNLLMSKIKRTTDKGENMKALLDKIHSKCVSSREGSFDSCHSADDIDCDDTSESTKPKVDEINKMTDVSVPELNTHNEVSNEVSVRLTPEEEAYTTRRSERLKRLEEESKLLMTKLSRHSQRGTRMNSRIDALHLRYRSEEGDQVSNDISSNKLSVTKDNEKENLETVDEGEGAKALLLLSQENLNEAEDKPNIVETIVENPSVESTSNNLLLQDESNTVSQNSDDENENKSEGNISEDVCKK